MTKRCIILNPHAGRGLASQRCSALVQAFREAKLDVDLVMTIGQRSATSMTVQLLERGYDQIIVVGGDGTLNEVVNGILSFPTTTTVSLGIVAMGTGNDFIKSLNGVLADDIQGIVQRVKHGSTRTIDAGKATITTPNGCLSRYFINDLGMGIYALVAAESHKITRLKGWLVYAVAVVRALAAYRATPATIRFHSHEAHQRLLLACVSNGSYQGAGFRLTPDALLDDGLFDVCLIDAVPLHTLLRHLPKAIHGTHIHNPHVTMGRTRQVVVDYDVPAFISTDGEIVTTDACHIEVDIQPGVLTILL